MDAFAQTLMKDAVNCDKHSDLQNSVNQLDFEYGLCCRGCPCKHTFSMYLALCTALHTVLTAHQGHACPDMHCSVHKHKRSVLSWPAFSVTGRKPSVLSYNNYDVDERTH